MTRRALALVPLLAVVALAGCGGDREESGAGATLTVLAAASLTDVYGDLARDFEAEHDGVEVEFSFGSSTDLAETAADQAPGDVLATADETSMRLAVDAGGTAEPPVPFATNALVLVTGPGNPAGLTTLADLDGVTWVRCGDDVPCGRVALTLLDEAGVDAEPASLEADVRATLEKVTSGEADAGLVYASDAVAAGDAVEVVEIDGAETALTTYVVAPLTQSEHPDLAAAWVDLVTGEQGRAALAAAGFTLP